MVCGDRQTYPSLVFALFSFEGTGLGSPDFYCSEKKEIDFNPDFPPRELPPCTCRTHSHQGPEGRTSAPQCGPKYGIGKYPPKIRPGFHGLASGLGGERGGLDGGRQGRKCIYPGRPNGDIIDRGAAGAV